MSVLSTVLIYVVIPAVCIGVIVALSRAGSNTDRPSRRYRPGRPYDFRPTWFLAAPDQVTGTPDRSGPDRRALHRHEPHAIAGPVIEDMSGAPVLPGPTGGASDRW